MYNGRVIICGYANNRGPTPDVQEPPLRTRLFREIFRRKIRSFAGRT